MAADFLGTADVLIFRNNDWVSEVSDVLDDAPALQVMAAQAVPGQTALYWKRTANPVTGFRAANTGRDWDSADRSQITATLTIADGSFAVDVAIAQADVMGIGHALAAEGMAHLRSLMATIEKQVFQGTVHGDASGFSGLADQSNLNQLADAQVINAAGTTASTGSSCWLVASGPEDVQMLWGQGGEFISQETTITPIVSSGVVTFPAYYTPMTSYVGLKVGGVYSAIRICNLTEDTGKGLTDLLLAKAIAAMPVRQLSRNVRFYMNRRSLRQLRDSRTATNPSGAPAPFPTEAFGIPIVVTDQIISTETLIA